MKQVDLIQQFWDDTERTKMIDIVQRSSEVMRQIPSPDKERHQVQLESASKYLSGTADLSHLENIPPNLYANFEAIVLERLRPAWVIDDDKIDIKENKDDSESSIAASTRKNVEALEKLCVSVGRIDIVNYHKSFVGTGWLIRDDIVVTNAHVVREFLRHGSNYEYAPSLNSEDNIQVQLNYKRQYTNITDKSNIVILKKVLYIGGKHAPDIAFLEVDNPNGTKPLPLLTKPISEKTLVAAVGYPAADTRNDQTLMRRIFGEKYRIKRFSPGFIYHYDSRHQMYLGDYTTLGGSSGSALLTIEATPKVAALHFAGEFRLANYSVPADIVEATLQFMKTSVQVPKLPPDIVAEATDYGNRNGYNPDFFGIGELRVPLPNFSKWENSVAKLKGSDSHELKYTHFSIVQCAARQLPLIAAVNIDGGQAKNLKRQGNWRLDGRIEKQDQIGYELYHKNDLDRGHMVRRMDPGWGDVTAATQAEIDTFHYTNSAPQHKNLNQKTWLSLEDYILRSSHTKGFKLSVFTGPVLRDSDTPLQFQRKAENIKIPKEFWKIAVMINEDTGRLSATGYILSQGDMIRGMTETAFVLGAYRTYQVEIKLIEDHTNLDFRNLRNYDPLNTNQESVFGMQAFEIRDSDDLVL